LAETFCVLKLNGGLGTTMGCSGPKSVIEVRGEDTFLDLTVQQIELLSQKTGRKIPLILMNSFNTHKDTLRVITKYEGSSHEVMKGNIKCFNQSRFPRIYKESFVPCASSPKCEDKEQWYPPGHGDTYRAFANCGLLDEMIAAGKKYVFISNVDNLGATPDFRILKHMTDHNIEFAMEVTDKTRADVKGGTLIDYEGRARLLELAQVPPDNVSDFKSIKKFKIFNTNNLWVNLEAMKLVLASGVLKDMDVIVNPKEYGGKPILQLETAVGAAIEFFGTGGKTAIGINVPRSRFLPVKSCSDLFLVQSNIFELQDGGFLQRNQNRIIPEAPLVKLDDVFFKKVQDYMARFRGVPDISELESLTVSGNVWFGKDISLRGSVIIVAHPGGQINIPSGTVLENKVVTGNLRILDH